MSIDFSLARDLPSVRASTIETPVRRWAGQGHLRAQDRNVPRSPRVAIKIVTPPARAPKDQRAAALRELLGCCRLRCTTRPCCALPGLRLARGAAVWFAMPWLEGEDALRGGAAHTDRKRKPVFAASPPGLSALHAVGIRHQDLKPANVFLSKVTG
ncbi:MAG: hypothetical protein IPH72_30695 [Sandaracinaceae bacterium]|nr:hypothetical protein [Sandaracinaceae bacterium]